MSTPHTAQARRIGAEPPGRVARALDVVERVGNRLPDPLTLFFLFGLLVLAASWLASAAGVSVVHPGTKAEIAAHNLVTAEGVRRMFTQAVGNFTAFPPLGTVLVAMIGIGIAERSGLIAAALRQLVAMVPTWALPGALVFGGIMSSMAADAGYVVLTPLGAVLFAGLGRHPIAGLAAAFAGVSGGYSANVLLTSLDPLLAGFTEPAARIVDATYTVEPTANYYFMLGSVVLVTVVGTFVTTRWVEPRLGSWSAPEGLQPEPMHALTSRERGGLWAALATFVLVGITIVILALPGGVLRGEDDSLQPFYDSLVPLIMLGFLLPGLAYGVVARSIRSDRDVAKMAGDTLSTMGAYIVLAFVAAQFVAWFTWSNLGMILAVNGAALLKAVRLEGLPLIIAFVFVAGALNLFIGSASAKWAVMAPVFVPMLMLSGYSPETVMAAYRVGDSVTNIITPLLPYFPIIIAFARRYDPKAGLGTLISTMLPYSVAFAIAWTVMLVGWIALGLPLGPDAPLRYTPPGG